MVMLIDILQGALFGFGIGINVTNAVFLGEPAPLGFGFGEFGIAGMYGTPIVSLVLILLPEPRHPSHLFQVAVVLGELLGRYLNDWIMRASIRRNNGVFEAESRLYACYLATVLYVVGFVVAQRLVIRLLTRHIWLGCSVL